MPIRNSRRAVIEAQCYLDRKRQNISKEDLERVKAFAEMYQPRARVASGSTTESRGTKRPRSPSTRRSSPPFATRPYPNPLPSPSSTSFRLAESLSVITTPSPSPRSSAFNSLQIQSPCTPRPPTVISACINAIRQWIMALLAFFSLARAWWNATTAWMTFMFTATFGALCSIKSPAYSAPDGRHASRPPGSASALSSIIYSSRLVPSSPGTDQTPKPHPHVHQLPSPPPSPAPSQYTPSLPIKICATSLVSIDEALRSRRIMTSFGYDMDACDAIVEDDSWEIQLAQHFAWLGKPRELGVALNVALDSSLARLTIINCSISLDDVIAILRSCEALQTLEVQDVRALHPACSKQLLPRQRYAFSSSTVPHQLKVLCIASAVPCEGLFTSFDFGAITRLALYGYDAGVKTAFPSLAMLPMKKTLKTFSLFGDFKELQVANLKSVFPTVTCNGS